MLHEGKKYQRLHLNEMDKDPRMGDTLSTPFWCLCQNLSLSPLYFNKTLLHKSSGWSSLVSGPRLNSSPLEAKNPGVFVWFRNNLSSWGLVQDTSEQGKDAWSSSSLFSQWTRFPLYFTNSTVWLCEWMKRPAWSKWGALLCSSTATSYGLWLKPVRCLYWPANAKRNPTSPLETR